MYIYIYIRYGCTWIYVFTLCVPFLFKNPVSQVQVCEKKQATSGIDVQNPRSALNPHFKGSRESLFDVPLPVPKWHPDLHVLLQSLFEAHHILLDG